MKKCLFSVYLLSLFLLAWCWNNTIIEEKANTEVNTWNKIAQEINNNPSLEDTIIDYIATNYDCKDWSKLFVNYAELWQKSLDNWISEWYIVTQAEWFYIDERWNLNNSCGFGVPMKITLSTEDWIHYTVIDSVQARDWNEYDISLKEMFSDEAIDRLYNWDSKFLDRRTLLEQAEEYFWVTIIPEEENNFECKFCDKLWYYEPFENDDWKSNELIYNYVSKDNWNNTIYFGSDWSFEAKGSWDAWTWIRTFGQDENTVIVSDSHADHIYSKYIITNQTKDSLNTILEIIQRT